MHSLDKEHISSWKRQKGSHADSYFPGAISSSCPHCNATVTFSFSNWHKALHGFALAKSTCPSCNETARFMMMDYDATSQTFEEDTTLWIYPPLNILRTIPDMASTQELDSRLLKAYESTLAVYNSGEWNATAILARRFLDGIIDNCMGGSKRSLNFEEQIGELSNAKDLALPIKDLKAILHDSNINQIFNLEEEPDQRSATHMIEFINLLVEYLFILPMRTQQLHQKIQQMTESIKEKAQQDSEIVAEAI